MLQVINLNVTPISIAGPLVEWEILPTMEDVSLFRFIVQRAEAPSGPFVDISGELLNTFMLVDVGLNTINDQRRPYYRILVRNKATGEEEAFGRVVQSGVDESDQNVYRDFGPMQWQGEPNFPALEIIRRYNLLLQRFIGTDVTVLQQKTFGQRCLQCWDPIMERQLTSRCMNCYNTGWVGGFENPIVMKANFHPKPVNTSITEIGEVQGADTAVRLSNLPRVKPRDIIVNMVTGQRWRVVAIQTTESRGFVVSQTCNIADVNSSDIENLIPIGTVPLVEDQFKGLGMGGSGLL